MKIQDGQLSDVDRYIENHERVKLEDKAPYFETMMKRLRRFAAIDGTTRILEIGTGTGWFPIMCAQRGLRCKGIEISRQLVDFAHELGRRHGIEPDVELGNIEDYDLGVERYDVIVSQNTFEHVERWRQGLERVARALTPGGLFYFYSTNKFMLHRSGEYCFPFYGWLPDKWRYRLRIARQGEDIMKLGIDFNQFTFPQLRRAFRKLGFSRILDPLEFVHPDDLNRPAFWKKAVLAILRVVKPLRFLALMFLYPGTYFICVKGDTASDSA